MTDKVDVVDLSHWQATVDFKQLKSAGVIGVILKATEGSGNTDQTFASRYKAARDAGLEVSSYHFLRPGNIISQVDRYLNVLSPRVGERVCLDHEDSGVSLKDLENAVRHLQGDDRNLQITIYSGNVIKQQLGNKHSEVLADTSLWLAQYGPTPSWPKGTWPTWTLWQYSDKGAVPGVSGDCDVNHFNGSAENCKAWMTPAGQAPVPIPDPAQEGDTMSISIETTADIKVKLVVNGEVLLLP